jgi:hypothetical protein
MKIVFPYSSQIASLEGIELKQGDAVKHGEPVLVPEYPWENVLAYLYGSVLKTTIYRMWYQAGGIYVAHARSRDGRTKSFAIAGGDASDHVLQTFIKDNVVLKVAIENPNSMRWKCFKSGVQAISVAAMIYILLVV